MARRRPSRAKAIGREEPGEAVDWSDLGMTDSSVVPLASCDVAQDGLHIAVSQLWDYSQEPIFLKIPPADRNHLRECQDCVAVIWLCRSVSSIEAVEARLKQRSGADL